MGKPTDEQIKEFWEWCRVDEYHDWTGIGDTEYEYCKKCGCVLEFADLPCHTLINLDKLFKYAVPEDAEVRLRPAKNMSGRHCVLILDKSPWEIDAFGETNELALFWALWKVKEAK